MYAIGNCYCWAHLLQLRYGGTIFTVDAEPGGRDIKHYMLRDRNGRIRHFKRTADFLPYPLCLFLFIGRLDRSGKKRDRPVSN